jgi:HlyD family secretion protein
MSQNKPLALTSILVVSLLVACDGANDEQRIVGQLESDRVEISAEVSEPILERKVIEGQKVKRGQLLIQQDTSRIETAIMAAEAYELQTRARLDELIRGPRKEEILAAQANVRGGTDDLEFWESELVRARDLLAKEMASAQLYNRAKAGRDAARASLENFAAQLEALLNGTTTEELRQAEESVRQAEERLASLQIDLERHSSLAPADGVVDSLLFEVGERPVPGQPMAILLSGAQVYARVYVPESMRVHVGPGTKARVFVDGLQQPLAGRVRWVASESAFTPYFALTEHDRGRLSFVAKVDILDSDRRLPDGVPVEVELLLDRAGTQSD